MCGDRTLRMAALIKMDDPEEAQQILHDIIQTVRDRLEYWGIPPESESPYTLIGEIS